MELRFTPGAKAQLLAALGYIQEDSPDAALAIRHRIETVLRRLEKYPASGRVIPEFPALPHREVIVPPYRIFYRTEGKAVWVVAVWHGAQLVKEPPPGKGTP